MTPSRTRRTLAALTLFAPLLAAAQGAANFPTKPIRFVVGYPAGSSPDMQARMLAEPLSKALGQPVVIENKPGAGGNLGADLTAKGDDHTIGIIGNGPLTSAPFLFPQLPYKPLQDLAPLALVGAAPLVWIVPKAEQKASAQDYVAQLRQGGKQLAYGSTGVGAGTHLGMELIRDRLGLNLLHVPFNGGPPVLNAMAGGQIQLALMPASTAAPMVQSGRIAAVAVTSTRPSPLAPGLPSMEDLGIKGVSVEVWNAIMAPASMPAAHRQKLSSELIRIIDSRETRQKLLVQGWKVDDPSPAALRKRMEADAKSYGDIIRKQGIKLE
ncbi:MAG TPA: tripartite tricarboxylate transporter substrate binding protein [Ramlibacter sp.]|nr:tripartite tricarboxylate transporter substrate binding protein [Ramlibacter sp.]